MLAARGTKRFYEISRRVYGDPRDRFPDSAVDNLAIARLWASRPRARDEEQVYSADEAAVRVAEICNPLLGGHVKVAVRSRLTANAAAGATRITLRKGARFSARSSFTFAAASKPSGCGSGRGSSFAPCRKKRSCTDASQLIALRMRIGRCAATMASENRRSWSRAVTSER